jgi:hypothetical protein
VLLGYKFHALKLIIQVNKRRTELNASLALLQPKVDEEALVEWLDDCDHDAAQRRARIGEMLLASGRVYSTMERGAIETCLDMFTLFDSSSDGTTQQTRSATIKRLETKQDSATRRLLGRAEAEIRADVLDIVAKTLHALDCRYGVSRNVADPNAVRIEVLEKVNPFHSKGFARYKARGMSDRSFVMSMIAKQVAEDPLTYVVAVVPIPSHDKITQQDEAGAVRAENHRSFRLTALAPGLTNLEYCCSLDLKGWVPQVRVHASMGACALAIACVHGVGMRRFSPLLCRS